ncbi:MAG: hypothetical protein WDW36_008417 [Sanguina aurantia]
MVPVPRRMFCFTIPVRAVDPAAAAAAAAAADEERRARRKKEKSEKKSRSKDKDRDRKRKTETPDATPPPGDVTNATTAVSPSHTDTTSQQDSKVIM